MAQLDFYEVPDRRGNMWTITFAKDFYTNGNLCIEMFCQSEDGDYIEDYATLTVNIEYLGLFYRAAVDINNLGDNIVDWLVDEGFAEDTGITLPSGFCEYPVLDFNQDWIDEMPYMSEM